MGTGLMVGDEIATAANSRVKIWFKDESVITLAEKSRFKIDSLDYNPGVSRKSVFTLVTGKAKALVSGWFSRTSDEEYQVHALSTVAGVRGTEFIVEVKGEGPTATASFLGISGTVTLWNPDHPEDKVSLTASLFIQILNGQVPGVPKQITDLFLEEFSEGLLISTGSRDDRNSEILGQIIFQFPFSIEQAPGEDILLNLGQNLADERTDYTNPTDLILETTGASGYTAVNINIK
jgi:hypothetical protein